MTARQKCVKAAWQLLQEQVRVQLSVQLWPMMLHISEPVCDLTP